LLRRLQKAWNKLTVQPALTTSIGTRYWPRRS
jgi:hypothetical protein